MFIIAAGTALAGYGEVNISIVGMLIQMVSECAEAGRLIMTQTLLQGLSFHPIESMLYIAPASVAWMLIGSVVTEIPEMLRKGGLDIIVEHAPLFFLAASLGFVVTTLAFFTIQLCGSLTLKVLLLVQLICKSDGNDQMHQDQHMPACRLYSAVLHCIYTKSSRQCPGNVAEQWIEPAAWSRAVPGKDELYSCRCLARSKMRAWSFSV